jgi:hypothetical protein
VVAADRAGLMAGKVLVGLPEVRQISEALVGLRVDLFAEASGR